MNSAYVYQIYYNEETKQQIQPGFIPLDNTNNLRPDWFEFWVILNFLRNNKLEEDSWYGFFSPKFTAKTGFSSFEVDRIISTSPSETDIFLFSPAWDQICYFQNSWEQGDAWHPGLKDISQEIFNKCNIEFDISKSVGHTKNTVYSNYFLAKKSFWTEWQSMAEIIFNYLECEEGKKYSNLKTPYAHPLKQYPIKTFIQERIVNILLSKNKYTTIASCKMEEIPIFEKLFSNTKENKILLQACNLLKILYTQTNSLNHQKTFWQLQKLINYSQPYA